MLVFDWKIKWIYNILILKNYKHLLTSNEYYNTHGL
ncbi:hypothetical protein EV196_101718 [Mariniflexile fucanivorans]|uniref:Uncharacterized protein n=1 Tax=Mariniflexile fucanivorans TaxID=264023 RepID=A0A4R1RS39_9FLAO|nr:hypothetical protein EV196_101718 [Mariniflexile fucanivorans]